MAKDSTSIVIVVKGIKEAKLLLFIIVRHGYWDSPVTPIKIEQHYNNCMNIVLELNSCATIFNAVTFSTLIGYIKQIIASK